jgi:tetratricopeptide (TPR) repeat protein
MSRKLVARIGFAALLVAGSAFAQTKKDPKQPASAPAAGCKPNSNNVGCKVQTKEETKIDAVKSTRPEAPKEDTQKGPRISKTSFVKGGDKAELSDKKRKEALSFLDELIKTTPKDDKERPELLYRYAETLYGNSKSNNNAARKMDDEIYQLKKDGKTAEYDKKVKERAKYEKAANDARIDAFKKYKEVIDDYPAFPKRDEVLFYMGYNLSELASQYSLESAIAADSNNTGDADALKEKSDKYKEYARNYYKMLIKEFPDSKFLPDAFLEFAEFFFYDKDINSALKMYQRVAEYQTSNVYGYSVYMQGWCYYNLGEFTEAMKKFVETVNYSRQVTASGDKTKVGLEKEALRDIVRTYAQYGTPDKARTFFQKVGGEAKYKEMMASLGNFYFLQGQFLDSIDMYEQVIEIDPKSDDNYKYQYEVCNSAMALATQNTAGAKERIVTEMQDLSKMYRDMIARSAPADKVKDAENLTAQILKEVAVNWHNEAQKTKDMKQYDRAGSIYKEYVNSFPKAEDIYVMTWNYAELLFQLGEMGDEKKWEPAAEMYQKVVDLDPKGKHFEEAAFAAVVSYQNATRRDVSYVAPPDNKDNKPLPIPEREAKMLKAYQFYIEKAPNADNAAKSAFNMGLINYDYNHFDEAEPKFKLILEKYPNDQLAIYAAQYLLDIYILQSKYDALNALADKIPKDPKLSADAQLVERAGGIRLKARSKQCQDQYEASVWLDAVDCYDTLLQDFPTHPETLKIKFNLALAAENAKLIGRAIGLRKELTTDPTFAATPEGKRSVFALGRLYMNAGFYTDAAENFEKFANEFPGEPDALAALDNAATFREGLAEYEKAVENNKKYQSVASKQKVEKSEVAKAFFRVAQIREHEGDKAKTKTAYEQYVRDFGKDGSTENLLIAKTWIASYTWAEANKDKNKPNLKMRDDATKKCIEVVAIADEFIAKAADKSKVADQLNAGLDAAAECQFYIAEKGYATFESFKLPSSFDKEKLAQWLEGTNKTRSETSVQYLKIKDYGSKGWTLAALARIGTMSYKFMDGLYKAPLPAEIEYDYDGDGKAEKIKLKGELKEQVEDAVRTQLDQLAEPIRTDAIKAFSNCIDGANQANWYNEWSAQCEEYLNLLSPAEFPLSSEWKAEPTREDSIVIPGQIVKVLK